MSAQLLGSRLRHVLTAAPQRVGTVLGLDISTRVIGVAVLSPMADLLATQAIKASSEEHPFRVAAAVSEVVADLHNDFDFQHVAVEDVLKSFQAGRFHTQGLFKLAGLNGTVAYEAWRRTHATVEVYMPNAIRAAFRMGARQVPSMAAGGEVELPLPDGGVLTAKVRKGADESVKVAVLQFATQMYPDLAETWELTRTGTLQKPNYDRSDAILVALFGLSRHLERALLRDEQTLLQYCEAAGTFRRLAALLGSGNTGAAAPALAAGAASRTARSGNQPHSAGDGSAEKRPRALTPSAGARGGDGEHAALVASGADQRVADTLLDASQHAVWAPFKALHERTMKGEAAAAGFIPEEEPEQGKQEADSGPATGSGKGAADVDDAEPEDEDEPDEADAEVAPPKRRRRTPLFAGLSPAQVEALQAEYASVREAFRAHFHAAFIAEVVERRIAGNEARRRRALAARAVPGFGSSDRRALA
jgi:Holliday junction resolvasome RuvABC endonuclease subunit